MKTDEYYYVWEMGCSPLEQYGRTTASVAIKDYVQENLLTYGKLVVYEKYSATFQIVEVSMELKIKEVK